MESRIKEIVRIDDASEYKGQSFVNCFIYSKNETEPVLTAVNLTDCILMGVTCDENCGSFVYEGKYSRAKKDKLIVGWRSK